MATGKLNTANPRGRSTSGATLAGPLSVPLTGQQSGEANYQGQSNGTHRLSQMPNLSGEQPMRLIDTGTQIYAHTLPTVRGAIPIRPLTGGRYIDTRTGEVKAQNRSPLHGHAKTPHDLRKSITRLRYLIDCNFRGCANEVLISLTYRDNENMALFPVDKPINSIEDLCHNDNVLFRTTKDIKAFVKSLKRHYNTSQATIQYISTAQPHRNGKLHFHLLVKLLGAPFFQPPKEELQRLWSHGKVDIEEIQNIRSLGAYLSAHLLNDKDKDDPESVTTHYGRLKYYPAHMPIYTASKGLKRPKVTDVSKAELDKIVAGKEPEYMSLSTATTPTGKAYTTFKLWYNK